MKFFLLMLGVVSGMFMSCERHEFEGPNGTKRLHESHGAGDHGAAQGNHGDAHAAKDAATDEAKPGH
jgi:hypothetical protein